MQVRRSGRILLGPLVVAMAMMGHGAMPSDPPLTTDLEAIRAAGRAIQSLHVRKARPRPGAWLDQHREPGQTFVEFRASDPNRPTAARTTVYLQPLGDLDSAQGRLVRLGDA